MQFLHILHQFLHILSGQNCNNLAKIQHFEVISLKKGNFPTFMSAPNPVKIVTFLPKIQILQHFNVAISEPFGALLWHIYSIDP